MGLFNYLFFGSSERPHEHDWEDVEFQSRYSIELRVEREFSGPNSPPRPPHFGHDYDSKGRYIPEPRRRVCLTCGKCEDQISEYEAKVRRHMQEAEERKAKAVEIWSACVPEKNNG